MVAVVVVGNKNSYKITETKTGTNTDKNIEATTIKNNLILQQPKNKDKDKDTCTYTCTDTSKEKKLGKTNNNNTNTNSDSNTKKYKCCECYYRDTLDSRCCGICFYCGDFIYCKKDNKCCNNCISPDLTESWCFKNPYDYFNSGCFLTSGGYGNEPDCCCTVFAGVVLCKFALTSPWLLCSIFNGSINCVCGTDKNYLF